MDLKSKEPLIAQLSQLLSLNHLAAYQVNALWSHLNEAYETCLLAAMSQSLIMNGEDLEQELEILKGQDKRHPQTTVIPDIISGSAKVTVAGTRYYLDYLRTEYETALGLRYSPLCMELLNEQYKDLLCFSAMIQDLTAYLVSDVIIETLDETPTLTDLITGQKRPYSYRFAPNNF